jgi:2-keto-4-pentenoate hydratase
MDSLASARVKLLVNGAEVSSATGSNVLGNPITALTWLANELNSNNHMLQAGQLVMTGAAVAYKNVAPSDVPRGAGLSSMVISLSDMIVCRSC